MSCRQTELSRVTIWGAVINMALSALKLVAGIFGRSSAMIADAVHSLSDLVSDLIVLVMINISARGRDNGHDYGHGKFETLATFFASLLLIGVAIKLMQHGIADIRSVLSGEDLEAPSGFAAAIALLSVAVKEILYQWTIRVGRRFSCETLAANAWHHRTDALSSVGALIGIGGAILLGGKWILLDPLVSCIISVVIFVVAVKMSIPALLELTDASLPDETENEITRIISAVEGVSDVHDLKTRRLGPQIIIDVHIVVAPEMTVAKSHDVTIEAEEKIREKFGLETQISIHVEPSVDAK